MKKKLCNRKYYYPPKISSFDIFLEDNISNCSACIVPEGASNDILIKDYDSATETEDLYF